MQIILQVLLFIFLLLSIPVVIFFTARKIGEWIIGFVLLLAFLLYYAVSIVNFFSFHDYHNGPISWTTNVLLSYRSFILSHWPHFDGVTLLGIHL